MGTAETNAKLWGARAREWADHQEQTARPLYENVLAATRIGAGSSYLDVGCGAGMALQLAAALGAKVSGLDAAPDLLTIARERVPNGDIRQGEIEELPFADGTFDVVTGFNSFQYAAKPVEALREAVRVTKKGGHVVIATWSPPDLTEAAKLIGAVRPLLPPPPPGAPGPFALSDEAALTALAKEAGLTPVRTIDVDSPFTYPDLATALRGINSSGVSARAIAHSGEEAVTRAHEAVFVQYKRGDGSISVPNRFRYLLAMVG